jgi:hypothetical protein
VAFEIILAPAAATAFKNLSVPIRTGGRPAGILIGFASEEDWFEYRLEHHPEFLAGTRRRPPVPS